MCYNNRQIQYILQETYVHLKQSNLACIKKTFSPSFFLLNKQYSYVYRELIKDLPWLKWFLNTSILHCLEYQQITSTHACWFPFDMHVHIIQTILHMLSSLSLQIRSQHPSAWAAWQKWGSHSVQQANTPWVLKPRALTLTQLIYSHSFPLLCVLVKSALFYTSVYQLILHKHLSSECICYQSEIKYLFNSIINIQDTTLTIRGLLKLISPDSLYSKFPR